MPIVAPATPGDCFYTAYEACRIAIKYMTPVFYLSDGYLANGSEPWKIPDVKTLNPIDADFAEKTNANGEFYPYKRDEKTLARPWALPGTPGLEHRLGGIEKEENTGHVNYDPDNHHRMTEIRQEKVNRVRDSIGKTDLYGDSSGDLLVLAWGGTYGACRSATETMRDEGLKVSHAHLRWVNPFPKDLGEIIIQFKKVLIPEINMGQLIKLIRSEFLVDAKGLNLVRGRPIGASVIIEKAKIIIGQ
jgi:2-oxoglutarate ferredoxin oxidoreductase subunit alpha